METSTMKVVIVGDGAVGKTSFIHTYLNGEFPCEYEPTVFETSPGSYIEEEVDNHISFWDTAGQDQFARMRPLSYENSDVFLVCFDISNRSSFQNISLKWLPEVRKYCGLDVPTVLVGLKTDLRVEKKNSSLKDHDKSVIPSYVTQDEAMNLARTEKMFTYVECSAKMKTNCNNPVKKAVEAVRNSDFKSNRSTCCSIL